MADEKLMQVLEGGLPTYLERKNQEQWVESIHRDISEARRIFDERIGRHDYTDEHQPGKFEFSVEIDTSGIENELAISNEYTESVAFSAAGAAEAGREGVEQLKLVRKGTDELPEIRVQLEDLNRTALHNLGATAIGAGIVVYQIQGVRDDIAELADAVGEGFGIIFDQMEYLTEVVEDGFADLRKGQKAIIRAVGENARVIGRVVEKGFVLLANEIGAVRSEISSIFSDFKLLQETQHAELVSTIRDVAEHRFTLEADERYKFALQQFSAGNHRMALKELERAFEAQSSHVPSLILFGEICTRRAEFGNAKDAFFLAAQLAKTSGDSRAFEVAVLALAELERQVGNEGQAEILMEKSLEDWQLADAQELPENQPVLLAFEYYKKSLSEMADAILKIDFGEATADLDYNSIARYTLKNQMHQVRSKNATDLACDVNALSAFNDWVIGLRAACTWLRDMMETELERSSADIGKKREVMQKILSIYAPLHSLFQKFSVDNLKIREDDFDDLEKMISRIYHLIAEVCIDLLGDGGHVLLLHIEGIAKQKREFKLRYDKDMRMYRQVVFAARGREVHRRRQGFLVVFYIML